MKDREMVRQLQKELTLAIWAEALATANNDMITANFHVAKRLACSNKLVELAEGWDE